VSVAGSFFTTEDTTDTEENFFSVSSVSPVVSHRQ